MTVFGLCVGAAYMPPANGAVLPVSGSVWRLFCPVGRGFTPAEHYKITGSAGEIARPTNRGKRPYFPGTPARGKPLQTTRGRAYAPGARRLWEGYGP